MGSPLSMFVGIDSYIRRHERPRRLYSSWVVRAALSKRRNKTAKVVWWRSRPRLAVVYEGGYASVGNSGRTRSALVCRDDVSNKEMGEAGR